MSETVRRLRKQILTGVMTMIREVCRRKPRLLVGARQGALIVLMCSLPFVVEVALRQRVPAKHMVQVGLEIAPKSGEKKSHRAEGSI